MKRIGSLPSGGLGSPEFRQRWIAVFLPNTAGVVLVSALVPSTTNDMPPVTSKPRSARSASRLVTSVLLPVAPFVTVSDSLVPFVATPRVPTSMLLPNRSLSMNAIGHCSLFDRRDVNEAHRSVVAATIRRDTDDFDASTTSSSMVALTG